MIYARKIADFTLYPDLYFKLRLKLEKIEGDITLKNDLHSNKLRLKLDVFLSPEFKLSNLHSNKLRLKRLKQKKKLILYIYLHSNKLRLKPTFDTNLQILQRFTFQ